MYTRDYIMRLIEQLVQVIARVLFHKELKEYEKALEEIRAGGTRLTGLDWALFVRLNDEAMIEMLRRPAEMDRRMYRVVADLLNEEADILRLQGKDQDAWLRRVSAFSLYCESLAVQESVDVRKKAMEALDAIEEYELPPAVEEKRRRIRGPL
ncbi:MAG: DUF6483 family protein [Acidobacteriota bacterium]